jgi:hypothetical protein
MLSTRSTRVGLLALVFLLSACSNADDSPPADSGGGSGEAGADGGETGDAGGSDIGDASGSETGDAGGSETDGADGSDGSASGAEAGDGSDAGVPAGSDAGTDGSADASGAGSCAAPSDCPGEDETCRYRTCAQGSCGFADTAPGTPCGHGAALRCDGNGRCVECLTGSDCANGVCVEHVCVAATCTDKVRNAGEAGVDCGGSCLPCANGASCDASADCSSGLCEAGNCTACIDHLDCPSDTYCAAGSCLPKLSDGSTCSEGARCESGHCPAADGVCCDAPCAGGCVACTAAKTLGQDGVCAPVAFGQDPDLECADEGASSCGASGAGCNGEAANPGCVLYAQGTECGLASCGQGSALSAATCDGAGTCVAGTVSACAPYTCNGQGVACRSSCAGDGECAPNHYCGGAGTCLPKRAPGEVCSSASACLSGFCSDGVCCDSACGTCAVCNRAGAVGTCTYIAAATDPASECAGECDGAGACAGGAHEWSRRFGGASSDAATAVATDSRGNVLLAGYFATAIDFGGGVLTPAGAMDMFLVKLAADGTYLWSRRFGGTSWDYLEAITVTPNDEIVIAGRFYNSVDFGGGPRGGGSGYQPFVAKLNADGSHIWSQSFTGTGVTLHSVAVNAMGDVAIAGSTYSNTNLGGANLTVTDSYDQAGVVAIYDSAGTHRFSRLVDNTSSGHQATGVSAAPNGHFVFTGHIQGTIDFGGGPVVGANDYSAFLAAFDRLGNHVWSTAFPDTGLVMAKAVDVEAATGRIAITGEYRQTVNFGGGSLPTGTSGAFIAVLDAERRHLWSKGFQASDNYVKEGHAVRFDAAGNLVVAGFFHGTINVGGGSWTATERDSFLVKFATAGTHLWSRHVSGPSYQTMTGLALRAGMAPVVSCEMSGAMSLGGATLTHLGNGDACVGAFLP